MKRATKEVFCMTNAQKISIHALMKRATYSNCIRGIAKNISIHALMKRATQYKFPMTEYAEISIHALMKRATYDFKMTKTASKDFNPRPHEEGDSSKRPSVQ